MLLIDGKESQKKHKDSVSIVESQIRIVVYSENPTVTKKGKKAYSRVGHVYFCLYTLLRFSFFHLFLTVVVSLIPNHQYHCCQSNKIYHDS